MFRSNIGQFRVEGIFVFINLQFNELSTVYVTSLITKLVLNGPTCVNVKSTKITKCEMDFKQGLCVQS